MLLAFVVIKFFTLWELFSRNDKIKVKSAYKPKWPIRPELIPVSVALSD